MKTKAMASTSVDKEKRMLILVNPRSGLGKSEQVLDSVLVPMLNQHKVPHDVFVTKQNFTVTDYIKSLDHRDLAPYRSIVIVSGDGLIYEALNSLLSRPDWEKLAHIPFGVIPTGSGNGLAYTLLRLADPNIGGGPEAIQMSCNQVIKGESCLADLVKLTHTNGRVTWSCLSLGWGLLADIDIDSEWLRFLGELRFTLYGLWRCVWANTYKGRLSFKMAHYDSQHELDFINSQTNSTGDMFVGSGDDQDEILGEGWVHIEDKFTCLYAVYQSHISRVTKMAPSSTLTDQLIYLTYIRGRIDGRKRAEFMLAMDDGSHSKLPYVTVVSVSEFRFQPLEPSRVVVDGEVMDWGLSDGPVRAQVIPRAVRLLGAGS